MLTLKGVFVDRWMMQVYPSQRVLRVFFLMSSQGRYLMYLCCLYHLSVKIEQTSSLWKNEEHR